MNARVKLSEHFSLAEFTNSQTATRRGIDNEPTGLVLDNLRHTAAQMEKVRALLGHPIIISSGYRCPELNAAIGGSQTSQHMSGEAADFVSPWFGSPLEICLRLEKSPLAFDQLIYEGTWVHISFLAPRVARRQLLTWKPRDGYTNGIHG